MVLELLHDLYLALDATLAVPLLVQLKLLVHLDRQDHSRRLVGRHLDACVRARAQMLADVIISYLGVIASAVFAFVSSFV